MLLDRFCARASVKRPKPPQNIYMYMYVYVYICAQVAGQRTPFLPYGTPPNLNLDIEGSWELRLPRCVIHSAISGS